MNERRVCGATGRQKRRNPRRRRRRRRRRTASAMRGGGSAAAAATRGGHAAGLARGAAAAGSGGVHRAGQNSALQRRLQRSLHLLSVRIGLWRIHMALRQRSPARKPHRITLWIRLRTHHHRHRPSLRLVLALRLVSRYNRCAFYFHSLSL